MKATMTPRQILDRSITEKAFQQQIIDLAVTCGYMVYHTHDSRRCEPGFPDLVLCNGYRTLFFEVKRQSGRPTAAQCMWIDLLRASGQTAMIVRPSDWLTVESLIVGRSIQEAS